MDPVAMLPPWEGDDEALAHALIAGDTRAARAAWRRFAPLVHRILKRTFGPGNDVDDVHQDIFLAFFRKVPTLREPKSLEAFVVSITARTIKHELRRRRARRFMFLWGTPADLAADLEHPDVAPVDPGARQALKAFYAILGRLNAQDRTAFGLRYLEGMDLVQVSRALDMSVSTAKRHLGRIWKRVAMRVRSEPALVDYSDHLPADVTPAALRRRASIAARMAAQTQ